MPAPKKNRFWKARSSHGRKPTFPKPHILWNACVEYFNWNEDNPLQEEKVFHTNGIITYAEVSKMRAMTISGLCIYLDICEDTWANYRAKEDFFGVVTRAEKIIYNQKFSGAAADMLNPNIIARDLGLKDKQEIEQTIDDKTPKTPEERRARIKELEAKLKKSPTNQREK